MDSRQVSLLTKGYLNGWLTFDYKTPLSRVREAFILSHIERDVYLDVYRTKVGMTSALAGGLIAHDNKAKDIIKKPFDQYLELALPYQFKKSRIIGSLDKAYLLKVKQKAALKNKILNG